MTDGESRWKQHKQFLAVLEREDNEQFVMWWGGINSGDFVDLPTYLNEPACICEEAKTIRERCPSLFDVRVACITTLGPKWNGYHLAGRLTDARYFFVDNQPTGARCIIAPRCSFPLDGIFQKDKPQTGTLDATNKLGTKSGNLEHCTPGCVMFVLPHRAESISDFLKMAPFA